MSVPPKWDKYEAAILLDALLKVKDGIPKTHMVNLVSFKLRQKAINQNLEIDDIYRNANGISFQMTSMDSAYEQANMGKPATKLFAEIAELYHNDYEAYEKILMEAMQMAEYSSDIKDSFIKYVSEKQPELATDILHAVKCMENFAVSTKALSHSVYEDLTEETITILKKKVLNHKFFTVRFKSILPYARLGLQIIEKFVEESNNCVDNSEKDTSETSIATNKENTQNKASELYYVEQDKDDFYHWLLKQGIAENTGRMYVRAVEDSEKLALKFGLSSTTLYTNDKNVAIATANALNNSEDFISYNNEKHRRFSAAIKKLLQYYGVTANNKRSRTVHNYVAPPIKSTYF